MKLDEVIRRGDVDANFALSLNMNSSQIAEWAVEGLNIFYSEIVSRLKNIEESPLSYIAFIMGSLVQFRKLGAGILVEGVEEYLRGKYSSEMQRDDQLLQEAEESMRG